MQSKQLQTLKQVQHLIMSHQMQQAFHFLQLPIMEIEPLIEEELEQNPILERVVEVESDEADESTAERDLNQNAPAEKELNFSEHDFEVMHQLDEEFQNHFTDNSAYDRQNTKHDAKQKVYLDSLVCYEESLNEHLMKQARETFSTEKKLAIAEILIGNLDAYGFLHMETKEIAVMNHYKDEEVLEVLREIQTFEPIGVGAQNLNESLLIQLRFQRKQDHLAYKILENYYDDLLHRRFHAIKKALHCSVEEIAAAIEQDISRLELHPGMSLSKQVVQHIVPDVVMKLEDEELIVTVNDDPLPPLRLNARYVEMLQDPALASQTKEFIERKIASAKWMLRNLTQRNETLVKIAHAIAKKQRSFFMTPEGNLFPMTMTELARDLNLHESTVARAVMNKYVDTPRGLLLLRSLFTSAYVSAEGIDISSRTVRNEIQDMVDHENKQKPLSDEAISAALQEKGIACARRTVAKYRYEMNLGNALQRKKYGVGEC